MPFSSRHIAPFEPFPPNRPLQTVLPDSCRNILFAASNPAPKLALQTIMRTLFAVLTVILGVLCENPALNAASAEFAVLELATLEIAAFELAAWEFDAAALGLLGTFPFEKSAHFLMYEQSPYLQSFSPLATRYVFPQQNTSEAAYNQAAYNQAFFSSPLGSLLSLRTILNDNTSLNDSTSLNNNARGANLLHSTNNFSFAAPEFSATPELTLQDSTRRLNRSRTNANAATINLTSSTAASTNLGTTQATVRLSTEATLSSRAIAAANIPLLSVPAIDLNGLADSLGIRRGAVGGAFSRKGTDAIPYSGQNYIFQAKFDSTLNSNAIRMQLGDRLLGTEFRPRQTQSLDDYLTGRTEYIRARTQDSITSAYDFRRPFKLELSSLLSQGNNFNIPFPLPNLTTIFGKPELRLNVNLEINLRIGVGFNATVGAAQASTLGAIQPFPIFAPNVQANVDAKLGDKFNINLDMNTLRQFEFDNLTRLAYDGEPDEIFRRIELGNVTLNTPSGLIGGSQALFGLRTDFQFGPVYLKTVLSTRRGQSRVATVKGGSVRQPIQLRAYDYADNHFFVNIAHKNVVWRVFEQGGFPLQATPNTQQYRVKALEVWESTPDLREIQASDAIAIDNPRLLTFADPVVNGMPTYSSEEKRAIFDTTKINPGTVERGRFRKLTTDRYTFDENLGTIRILNLRRDRSYAIAYRMEGPTQGPEDDLVYGTFQSTLDVADTASRLILQLVYRPNMQPAFRTIWARQRQNVYFIGATNVSTDPKDTRINFWYLRKNNDSTDVIQGASDKLATILGVDRTNNTSGAATPDGLFDIHLPYIFDRARGEITFTSLEPFRQGIIDYFTARGNASAAEPLTFSAVYDTTRDAARLDAGRDRFVISGEVAGQSSNRINLPNAFNLAPGSVKVRLNGALLNEFQDYRVEYFTGQVEILNPQALLPSANLEVEYEQNDAFNLATRTMVGARLDIDTKSFLRSRDVRLDLGMTFVNYTQDNPSARIRLSEEPLSNTMVGIDGGLTLNADWLTKALDALPFYDTKASSGFSFKGEAAWALNNPNTRPSEILSDNNLPSVFIDDFEATQRIYALGVQPAQWRFASPPSPRGITGFDSTAQVAEVQNFRGAMKWYAFTEQRVDIREVYPNRAVTVGLGTNNRLRPLEIDFNPHERGIYNTNPLFIDSITFRYNPQTWRDTTLEYRRIVENPALRDTMYTYKNQNRIWGGMMRTLSAFNLNFDNENMDFIEIVMNVSERDQGTRMFIDVGQISEDVIPNGRLDTEDGILPGRETPNGRIADGEANEDVGIDGLSSEHERGVANPRFPIPPSILRKYGQPTTATVFTPYTDIIRNEPDPARDNWWFDTDRFRTSADNAFQRDSNFYAFNGLEGNSRFVDFLFPDTEIMNANNGQVVSQADAYFRYEVNLTADRSNPQFVNNSNGWVTYRIPLRGARTTVGNALFTNIQYVRALWTGGRMKARIIDWRFVGSQWVRQPAFIRPNVLDSTTLTVGFVGREENQGAPFFYTMPPGVSPPIARNNFLNPNQFSNEQSLLMQFNELQPGQERSVSRFFRPFDAFFYKQMKFFLNGGENITRVPQRRRDAQAIAFIRFGVDTLNYYEYSIPLKPGWQEVAINLQELTGLKPIAQLNPLAPNLTVVQLADSLGEYRIKGSPTLTRIQFVNFGILNPQIAPLTTSMWVNELRLIDPDTRNDWQQNVAAVGTASARIADLGTVTGTINLSTPYFTRLEDRFGNRNNRQSLAVTGQFALERFFPEDWSGTSIPISFTYNQSTDRPRFLPQNDVSLVAASFNEASRRRPGANDTVLANIAQEIQDAQFTTLTDMQFAITGARLNVPSLFFFFRDFLNRLTFDYNYVQRTEQSPVVSLRNFSGWRTRLGYNHSFPQLPIKPFGWAENIPVLQWLSGWTIFAPLPNTITANVEMGQNLQQERSRIQPDISIPLVMNFDLARQMQLTWKIEENGFLNPTLDYSVQTAGTLVPLWAFPGRTDTVFSAENVWRQIVNVSDNGLNINLGRDTRHAQNIRLTFRPKFPEFMGGAKFFNLTGSYGSQYGWERLLRPLPVVTGRDEASRDALNVGVGYQAALNTALGIRLKEIGNTLFPNIGAARGGLQFSDQPLVLPVGGDSTQDIGGKIFRTVKSVIFDWDQLNFTYSMQRNANNPGVLGGTGFGSGPTIEYQLGLVEEPHNTLFQRFLPNGAPGFNIREVTGVRPIGFDLPDVLRQNHTFDIRAQREIIPGFQLELSWGTKVEDSRNQIINQIDSVTRRNPANVVQLWTYGRSFFVGFGGLENVRTLYNQANERITALTGGDTVRRTRLRQEALNDAFVEGLEGLNWWSGALRPIMPNLNFALRWNGIEQLPMFQGVLRSGMLESKYVGRYSATRRREANIETIDQQAVQSSFEPLLGVTLQFDDKFVEGVMQGNARYGNKQSYGIAQSQQGIVQQETQHDFTLQFTYQRRGFELPKIGGLSLLKLIGIDFEFTNDIEFGMQATVKNTLRQSVNILARAGDVNAQGRRIDGTTNILVEPSVRYTISKQVTARLFFRYEANLTEGATAPGSSVTQFGVDLRLNLSGGRNF